MRLNFTLKLGKRILRFRTKLLKNEWGLSCHDDGLAEFHPKLHDRSKFFQTEIVIHESLHLLVPEWSEKRITMMAHILARILRKARI